YTYEQVLESQALRSLLPYIDVLVDGPFVEAERDLTLHFRGSRNQRIIHLHDEK
ncbi:MAG: 4Fe-4S cluster-binding domain-containing protein, partial [Muribaculaceae bacterium]|nr:4Fe-4S cluster-binding domain-containing protein [Muribaculaceae bacterium]